MPHVYLPTEHSEADLVMAGQLAELLESDELYVTWSPRGYQEPQIETIVRVERPKPVPAPAQHQHSLLTEVLGTMAAFVASLFAPRPAEQRTGTASA
ncbi:MAG TPA: hypothetical protein VF533_21600 [Solirubrobacteraceae bacterium]|jgi:hypothetical protein